MSTPLRVRPPRAPRPGGSGLGIVSTTEALQTVKRDFDNAIAALADNRVIERLIYTARNLIQNRTFRGQDINDSQFPGYSPYWARVRAAKGLPTDRVTLRFAGTMYGAIGHEIESPRRARLYVRDHVGGGNNTSRAVVAEGHQRGARKWFGFSPKDRRILEREAAAEVTEVILAQRSSFTRTGDDVSLLKDRYQKVVVEGRTADYRGLAALGRSA